MLWLYYIACLSGCYDCSLITKREKCDMLVCDKSMFIMWLCKYKSNVWQWFGIIIIIIIHRYNNQYHCRNQWGRLHASMYILARTAGVDNEGIWYDSAHNAYNNYYTKMAQWNFWHNKLPGYNTSHFLLASEWLYVCLYIESIYTGNYSSMSHG